MAKKISILNFKGGVGKTTTAVNLADAMHILGKKVLLVDVDAQRNSTIILDKDKEVKEGSTLYDALLVAASDAEGVGVEVFEHAKGFDFIAGDIRIANIEGALANSGSIKEMLLRNILYGLDCEYDYIFIDCPPNHGLMTRMALYASDSMIVPIDSQIMALDGLGDITKTYNQVKKTGMNNGLKIEGYLLTRYRSNLTTAKTVLNFLKDTTGNVFNAKIRENTTVGQAPGARMTIFEYDNTCAGAEDYMQLAKELLKRK